MAIFPDVSLYIQYGQVSGFLAANDKAEKRLFQGAALANDLPSLLEIVTESVEWLNDLDSSDETLNDTSLYLYALCGRYRIEAATIINAGNTGNIINPSTGQNVTIATPNPQFRVGDPGALMTAGETTITFGYTGVVASSLEITLDGVEVPYGDPNVFSFTATYSANEVTVVFSSGVQNNWYLNFHMVQLVNV